MLQRSFHHFDLSSSHFHLALTMGSLISYQRILIYCRSTEDIHPSIYRKWMGSSHFTQHMSAHINTQGDGASEHLGHCIIRCTTFIQPRLGWRKKQMKEEKESCFVLKHGQMLTHTRTHTSGKKTLSHCVFWVSVCECALLCMRVQEWPFRHVPDNSTHSRLHTLLLYSRPSSINTPSVTLVHACV